MFTCNRLAKIIIEKKLRGFICTVLSEIIIMFGGTLGV